MLSHKSSPESSDHELSIVMMPANVKPGQVLELAEIVGGAGGTADVRQLARGLKADLTVLLEAIQAAEILGLARATSEGIKLTEAGSALLGTHDNKVKTLRDTIATLEPFRTALELASRTGSVTSKEIVKALDGKEVRWDYRHEENDSIVNSLMINWSISVGLFKYEKSGAFLKLV